MDEIQAIEKGWKFLEKLPSAARIIIAIAFPIVATSGFIVYYTLKYQNNAGNDNVIKELLYENHRNWEHQFEFNDEIQKDIDSIKHEGKLIKEDIVNLTMITANNSNNNLINNLIPFISETEESQHRLLLNILRALPSNDTIKSSINITKVEK